MTPPVPVWSGLPNRPADVYRKVRQPAYPCVERERDHLGLHGSRRTSAVPGVDCFAAPDSHVFAFKGLWSCNWLQALEVGIDPGHASFLHRFFEDEEFSGDIYGRQFRAATIGADIPMTRLLRKCPTLGWIPRKQRMDCRITRQRPINDSVVHLRITNMVFPHAFVIPLSREMSITQWHVPVDETHCYWYAIFTSFTAPVDKATMRAQRLQTHSLPDYVPHANQSTTGDMIRRSSAQRPIPGWAWTSTCMINGQWKAWAPFRIARRSISVTPIELSQPHAG